MYYILAKEIVQKCIEQGILQKVNVVDSILCKECKKCLFINTLQLIIQSSTKYNPWKIENAIGIQCFSIVPCNQEVSIMLYMLLAANNFTSDIDIIAHSTDVAPVKEALAKTFLAKAKEVGIAKAEEWANHPVDWLLAGQESYSADSEASITDNGASVMQGGDLFYWQISSIS